jgi:drug/metabolite transporter (DMT)-like permease
VSGALLVVLAACSWGTWSLFVRPAHLPADAIGAIVFAVMAIVAWPLSWREERARWDREALVLLVGNAAFDALNVLAFFSALRVTTVAIAVLTHYFAPILIALAAPYVERTRAPGARPAAAVALVGLAIVLEPWREPAHGALAGAALGLASAACYAGNVFVVRRLATRIGNARAISYHSALAAIVMLPIAAGARGAVTARGLALVAAGGATVGALAGIAFTAGLRRIGSARAGVLAYAEPIVAVAVGALAFSEPVRPLAAVGGALVLAAGVHVARRC